MSSQPSTVPLPEFALDKITRLERLTHLADRAWNAARQLIGVSGIYQASMESTGLVATYRPASWVALEEKHMRVADLAAATAREWLEAAERVVKLNQPTALTAFQTHSRLLMSVVDRTDPANYPPTADTLSATRVAEEAIIAQLDLVIGMPSARQPTTWMWMPDTNALYDRHELHRWPASQPTFLVIAPRVVNELDAHKQDGRYPDRQKKARAIIDQIKNIRGRRDMVISGSLRLRHDGIWRRAWDELPDWLDRDHADDEILALAIELSWTSLRSAVTLITSDSNIQAKAQRVDLAYIDPEHPDVLIGPPPPAPLAGIHRALRHIIYAGFHRNPGDQFLAVEGHEDILQTHIGQGAVERGTASPAGPGRT